MVYAIEPILVSQTSFTDEQLDLILRAELQLLTVELPDFQKFRAYYDGEQGMVFGTQKFKEAFGAAFDKFRDNWCAPVVEATADKLVVEGITLGTTKEEAETNKELAASIWEIFRENDIDEQQSDLHEGALVEGRAYAIAWPDERLGVRIDWQPADLIRVRYADDDPRTIIWAMKRWLTPSGEIYITEYTRRFIYKYKEAAREYSDQPNLTRIDAQRPENSPNFSFVKRMVPNEQWPLPNPFGVVPVIEFPNKRGSELTDIIPLQDGINYLILQAMTGAGFQGFPQRGMSTGVAEPIGGWSNEPGKIWQLPPDIDPEGALSYGSVFEFNAAPLDGFRNLVDMLLQHIALSSKTPVRYFFQSDRGGRGDAPSGESLLVEDQPLLDKVEDRQRRYGNAWFRLARLVNLMRNDGSSTPLPLGEMTWRDPRAKYRSALVAEGALMVEKMGMPLKFVIRQLGLTSDEIDQLDGMIEEQEQKAIEQEESKMRLEAELTPTPVAPLVRPPTR